ncbi:MAG: hypothetical protein ACRDQ7_10775 [Haloechinothrix sp.]
MADLNARDREKALANDATARLGTFVLRARRVEEHSLAADRQKLLMWAQGRANLIIRTDGPNELVWDLPEEEALDSLAARCRPFILSRESVYHASVMKALGYLLRDHEPLKQDLQGLKVSWKRLDPSSTNALGFDSQTGPVGGRLGPPVTDITLAYGWLYGDLVHADDITDRVGNHDIDARYQGASLVIAAVAVHAISTLNLVRRAHTDGLLHLDPDLFTARVTARTESTLTLTGVASAPVGTSREQLEALLDPPTTPSGADKSGS